MACCEQNQRETTLAGFRGGRFSVLVATDVAARGLDISGVELVLQIEPPKDPETYIHRSGGCGGAPGSFPQAICLANMLTVMTDRRLLRAAP
jgi:superfamily II DNA/RNA helicase